MKYLPVEVINSDLDSGTHPSGLCTCSTGNGFPWILVLASPKSTYKEAYECCKLAQEKQYQIYREYYFPLNEGWELYNDEYEGMSLIKEKEFVFVYTTNVIELDD